MSHPCLIKKDSVMSLFFSQCFQLCRVWLFYITWFLCAYPNIQYHMSISQEDIHQSSHFIHYKNFYVQIRLLRVNASVKIWGLTCWSRYSNHYISQTYCCIVLTKRSNKLVKLEICASVSLIEIVIMNLTEVWGISRIFTFTHWSICP